MLLITKYFPKNSEEIIGQSLSLPQLKDYIINYKSKKLKACLISGPIGCGKTSAVHAIANELNHELLELNSSDLRNEATIRSFLDGALGQHSLFSKSKIILLDEIDNISGVKDRGCVNALLKAIQKSSFPIICTTNSLEEDKLKSLKKKCQLIEFQSLPYKLITEHLIKICKNEKIEYEEKAVSHLARLVDGDLRAALLDLQSYSTKRKIKFDDIKNLSSRKRTQSILNALFIIFKSSSAKNALLALENLDVDIDKLFLWMDANLPKEYTKASSLAKAYNYLSRADVYRGRIRRRQYWRLLSYINTLLTAGISSAKDEKNPKMIQYKQTTRLLRIWQINMKTAKKKEIIKKLSDHLRISKKKAEQDLSYLRVFIKNNEQIQQDLELTNDEIEWLLK